MIPTPSPLPNPLLAPIPIALCSICRHLLGRPLQLQRAGSSTGQATDICTVCTCQETLELDGTRGIAVTCDSISNFEAVILSSVYPADTTTLRLVRVDLTQIPTAVLLQLPRLRHL